MLTKGNQIKLGKQDFMTKGNQVKLGKQFNDDGVAIFGDGSDGALIVSGTTTVTMRQIYENDNVTGITTYRGLGKGLNKGNATYMASADAMPNFTDVTVNASQKIIGDTSNRYADAGHTYFKCSRTLIVNGEINENGSGGAGGDNSNFGGLLGGANIVGVAPTKRAGGNGGLNSAGQAGANGSSDGGGGGGCGNTSFAGVLSAGGGGGYGGIGIGGRGMTNGDAGTNGSSSSGGNGGNSSTTNSSGGGGGGGTYGSANFGANRQNKATQFYIGSGGGRGPKNPGIINVATGGSGGGKIKILANKVTVNGLITANGGDGIRENTSGRTSDGGGGSGGAVWIISRLAVLGTNKILATGGGGGGGAGGVGRIRIDGNYTGTTNPSVGYNGRLI